MKLIAFLLALCATSAAADIPQVISATAQPDGTDWRFSVTLRHADTGWDHYADGWEVRLTNETIVAIRVLAHPHVTEQPFTRSLGGVTLPPGTTRVQIVPHDSVHGHGPAFELDLPKRP